MGCWNETCAVSNLHILNQQEVAMFLLVENIEKRSFCYNNALYDFIPLPFYGKYNDYGAAQECNGFGLSILLNQLKNNLVEYEQGENTYHDISVKRDKFNIDLLFEASAEDRLNICGLTNTSPTRVIAPIMIHYEIFNDILTKWKIPDYPKDKSFLFYKNAIPEFIENVKLFNAGMKNSNYYSAEDLFYFVESKGSDNVKVLSRSLENTLSNYPKRTLRLDEVMVSFIKKNDWINLSFFLEELLKGFFIDEFMCCTRKIWTVQTGKGSQDNYPNGYKLLNNSINKILKQEKIENNL